MILLPLPIYFLSSPHPVPCRPLSTLCHWTVKTRDVAAAPQHAVDFDSCVPVLSLPLCDAISDYIVITDALGVCALPPLYTRQGKAI